MEKIIKENVCMCVSSPFAVSRDWHNIVNQLYFNTKVLFFFLIKKENCSFITNILLRIIVLL